VQRRGGDGLAVDREGGVWVALGDAGGVARFCPDGERTLLRARSKIPGLPIRPVAV
jgi:sugar lactone lactonase YvrE